MSQWGSSHREPEVTAACEVVFGPEGEEGRAERSSTPDNINGELQIWRYYTDAPCATCYLARDRQNICGLAVAMIMRLQSIIMAAFHGAENAAWTNGGGAEGRGEHLSWDDFSRILDP